MIDGADDLSRRVEAALSRPARRDASLAEFSTYRLGGPAAVLAEPESVDELAALRMVVAQGDWPMLVVGRGSNLLVADEGFAGLVIHLAGDFERVEVGDTSVHAGAAVALPVLARQAAGAGRAGLEFYVGIPGSVGGAVRMNAGGHGQETRDVLMRAWVFDLAVEPMAIGSEPEEAREAADFAFAYRHSALALTEVVTRAEFRVVPDDPTACATRIDDIVRWRRDHQPGGSNAGSVFTNPPGDSAGRLIESCGLKGFRVGGAVVSPKHANFFQAEPGATAGDVRRLVFEVQRRVAEETGVHLIPELSMVGFAGPERPSSAGE